MAKDKELDAGDIGQLIVKESGILKLRREGEENPSQQLARFSENGSGDWQSYDNAARKLRVSIFHPGAVWNLDMKAIEVDYALRVGGESQVAFWSDMGLHDAAHGLRHVAKDLDLLIVGPMMVVDGRGAIILTGRLAPTDAEIRTYAQCMLRFDDALRQYVRTD